MVNSFENNTIYTAFITFTDEKSMIDYIVNLNKAHKDKSELIEYNFNNRDLTIYVKISKYKVWIKEPYFTLN